MLKSSKTISELFSKIPAENMLSRDFLLLRFSVNSTAETPFKFTAVVGKRSFKSAVDRNSLKRRIKESVRLNQSVLNSAKGVEFLLIYRSRKKHTFFEIDKAIKSLLKTLAERLESNL